MDGSSIDTYYVVEVCWTLFFRDILMISYCFWLIGPFWDNKLSLTEVRN